MRVICRFLDCPPRMPHRLAESVEAIVDGLESGRPACRVVGVSLALYEAADSNFPDSPDTWLVTLGTAGGPGERRDA